MQCNIQSAWAAAAVASPHAKHGGAIASIFVFAWRASVRPVLLDCRRPPRCTTSTHGGDTGATDDVEWSAIGDSFVPQFFTALSSDHGPPLAERKVRTGQRICASWSGLDLASLNHIKPRQYRLAMAKPRTRLDVSQQRYCVSAKATSFSSCRSSSLPSSLS